MDNMEQEDMPQDVDMVRNVLQKIIDEMDTMEAGRIHPKMVDAKMTTVDPKEEPMAEEMPEESGELDPTVLKSLLDKAGSSDDSGALPEDGDMDLPPSLRDAVRKKRMV